MDAPRRLHVLGTGEDNERIESARVVGDVVSPVGAEEVLDTLMANNGIIARAAAKLNMSEAAIMNVISNNATMLSRKARARLMLSSFVTVTKLDAVLAASADELSPGDLGRTYAASLAAFTNLAGQFEEAAEETDTDDADAAKEGMLERLARMGKREAAERAVVPDEAVS
jgi:hypothetical protein